MAHGPCGEEFRAAFSCFVFSEADPKGMDCIDNFKYVFAPHPFRPLGMNLRVAFEPEASITNAFLAFS